MSLVHVNKRCVLTIVIGVIAAIVVVGSVVLVVLCFHFNSADQNYVVVYRWGANKNKMVDGRNPVNGTSFLPLQLSVAEDAFPTAALPLNVSFLFNVKYYDSHGYTSDDYSTPMVIVGNVYFDYDQIIPFYQRFGNFSQNVRENYLKDVFKNITDLQFFEDDLNYDAHHRASSIICGKVNVLLKEYIEEYGLPFHFVNDSVIYARPFKTD